MSQIGHAAPAVLVVAMAVPDGAGFKRHRHDDHQIAWTDAGVLKVVTDDGVWVLPPTRALWIPAGVAHRTSAVGAAVLRGAYLDPGRTPARWSIPQPLAVEPLLAALLLHLGDGSLAPAARARAQALLGDLLVPVATTAIALPLPEDPRAREVAELLLSDPADPRPLPALGHAVGASERTLRRGFRDGTGLTFAQWRTAVRTRAALPRLAAGEPVSAVAAAVGYATPSAFVAAFRRTTGTRPGAYFEPARAGSRAGSGRVSASRTPTARS